MLSPLCRLTIYVLFTDSKSRQTFVNLARWLVDARALASPNLVCVLVGNKSDREEEREVEWSEASQWAAANGMLIRLLAAVRSAHYPRCR